MRINYSNMPDDRIKEGIRRMGEAPCAKWQLEVRKEKETPLENELFSRDL